MFQYAYENNCADGPLQRAIGFIANGFSQDIAILRTGLSMVVISLVFQIIILVYASPLRAIIACCIPSWKEKPAIEHKLIRMSNAIR